MCSPDEILVKCVTVNEGCEVVGKGREVIDVDEGPKGKGQGIAFANEREDRIGCPRWRL